jgi:aconitate hydratase
VRAVLAESFERIHRSNLVGMGVLPLEYLRGENRASLQLGCDEVFDVLGLEDGLHPGQRLTVRATPVGGSPRDFEVTARIDAPIEVLYYQHGGVMQFALRELMRSSGG